MDSIRYLKGDATVPQASGVKVICHICNDLGGWGKGFVLAISRRWKSPEAEYRAWHRSGQAGGFALGAVQFVSVAPTVWIANMIAQRGMKSGSSGPPIRYPALAQCLEVVGNKALELQASVHMPRIGCGLAGGDWARVEPLILEHLVARGISVTVYDYD